MEKVKLYLHRPSGAILEYKAFCSDNDYAKFKIKKLPDNPSSLDRFMWSGNLKLNDSYWVDAESYRDDLILIDNELVKELWL